MTSSFRSSIENFSCQTWNELVSQNNPFFSHQFFSALENSKTVGPNTGWEMRYISYEENGELLGALPFAIKTDSNGEFIFDFAWAKASIRAGIPYYPKITVAVPFMPVTGERILVHPQADYEKVATILIKNLVEEAQKLNVSSIHFFYLSLKEQIFLEKFGFLSRLWFDFYWHNQSYTKFDDFLADLKRKRRQQIVKERRTLEEQGIRCDIFEGDQIQKEHIELIRNFYKNTLAIHGSPQYLTDDFFDEAFKNLRPYLLLVLAHDGNEYVAGAFNFKTEKTLFGRYWGAKKDIPFLHFECCYYSLIDYCIKNKIEVFEPGAQGEHKFLRGFAPTSVYSSHLFFDSRLQLGIKKFLDQEKEGMKKEISRLNDLSPLRSHKIMEKVE